MSERERRDINIDQVTRYLSHAFGKVTENMGKATRTKIRGQWETTALYDLQVEFMYMLNEIRYGAKYLVPKVISDANRLINEISEERGSA